MGQKKENSDSVTEMHIKKGVEESKDINDPKEKTHIEVDETDKERLEQIMKSLNLSKKSTLNTLLSYGSKIVDKKGGTENIKKNEPEEEYLSKETEKIFFSTTSLSKKDYENVSEKYGVSEIVIIGIRKFHKGLEISKIQK